LLIECGDFNIDIAVDPKRRRQSGPGWEAIFAENHPGGVMLELHMIGQELNETMVIPVVVHFSDVDPGEVTTRLGTAAWKGMIGLSPVQE